MLKLLFDSMELNW